MATGTISLQSFAAEFLSLARARKSGTFKVVCADGRERYLLFQEGSIIDVDNREETSLLTTALLNTGRVTDREVRKAKKAQSKNGAPLGALLVGSATIPEEELGLAVRSSIADSICTLFTTSLRETAFFEHGPDERLEGFASELSEVLELQADPEDLFLEAAHRMGRWDLAERNFDILRDVYYATPAAFKYFQDEARYAHEVAIIGLIDGRNDFSEVIERAVEQFPGELDPFGALAIIRSLVGRGEVQSLNPVQLFQIGVEYQAAGRHEKAIRLFTRASDRGLDDFDLSFKIAQTLEALAKRSEAALRYQEYGEKCLAQFRTEDALKSYRKAAELERGNHTWQRKLLDLLLKENRREEALAQGLALAGRLSSAGDSRGGLNVLLELRRKGFKEDKLGQEVLELAEQCGDESVIQTERKRLASDFHSRKDVEKALQMYQQMFCEGNSSPEVRLKLIELHHQKGNHKLVLEHIASLFSLSESERIKDAAVLRYLHELSCELKPGEARSHRWLVEYHLKTGNRDAALGVLKNLAAHLEKVDDPRNAARVLRQMISVDEGCLEHRWRLAKALEKLGKPAEQIGELRGAADVALKRKEPREA